MNLTRVQLIVYLSTFAMILGAACAQNSIPPDSSKIKPRLLDRNCLDEVYHEIMVLKPITVPMIQGIAYDQRFTESEEPLVGALLILEISGSAVPKMGYRARSDEHGRFSFPKVEEGKYQLWSCLPGWEITRVPVTVDHSSPEKVLDLPMVRW